MATLLRAVHTPHLAIIGLQPNSLDRFENLPSVCFEHRTLNSEIMEVFTYSLVQLVLCVWIVNCIIFFYDIVRLVTNA